MNAPTRPVVRWHGGKWMLAPWIIAHLPPHRVYVEPFGGGASVLLRKERSYAETYNDLDGEVVTLFRVLRSRRHSADLLRRLELTPFARAEFEAAYLPADDDVETARRLVARSFMGFGSDGRNAEVKTGFRGRSNRSGTTPAHDWQHYPEALRLAIERLRGVVIESRPALDVIAANDTREGTLFYVDPPYLHSTRGRVARRGAGKPAHCYSHEMTDADHAALLEALLACRSKVLLSGYPSALYDDALAGWHRIERTAYADGARARTEVLWLNYPPPRPAWEQEALALAEAPCPGA